MNVTPIPHLHVILTRDHMKSLTAVLQPARQVVGHGSQIVLVGVDEHWGFGPGIVVCFSKMQSGSMHFCFGGGQFGYVKLVVAVKHGQGEPSGQPASAVALAQAVSSSTCNGSRVCH